MAITIADLAAEYERSLVEVGGLRDVPESGGLEIDPDEPHISAAGQALFAVAHEKSLVSRGLMAQ